MTHCMECGAPLETRFLKNEGMIPWCPACEQYRFPVYATAVSMVVTDESNAHVLLIQQYGKPRWILVAGYVTRGEAAEDTVVREVKEEVGLTVRNVRFNRSRFHERSNALMLNFTATVDSAERVMSNEEVDRWQWFTREEAAREVAQGSLAHEFLAAWLADTEKEPHTAP